MRNTCRQTLLLLVYILNDHPCNMGEYCIPTDQSDCSYTSSCTCIIYLWYTYPKSDISHSMHMYHRVSIIPLSVIPALILIKRNQMISIRQQNSTVKFNIQSLVKRATLRQLATVIYLRLQGYSKCNVLIILDDDEVDVLTTMRDSPSPVSPPPFQPEGN